MMSALLLDTHALLWWLADSPRMPMSIRTACSDQKITIYVSAISLFEIATKLHIGRFAASDATVARTFLERYDYYIEQAGFVSLAVTARHAASAGILPWRHRDSFDRILVAQAIDLGIPLATTDTAIRRYRHVQTI